jgi:hypothetical protein
LRQDEPGGAPAAGHKEAVTVEIITIVTAPARTANSSTHVETIVARGGECNDLGCSSDQSDKDDSHKSLAHAKRLQPPALDETNTSLTSATSTVTTIRC